MVLVAIMTVIALYMRRFLRLPPEGQMEKVRQWLLYAVIEAEKIYQGGTGQLKLRYVYSLFIEKFPSIAPVVPFDLFKKLVDDALEEMKHLLETNKDIEAYVESKEDNV